MTVRTDSGAEGSVGILDERLPMEEASGATYSDDQRDAVVTHYRTAGPLLVEHFGRTPVIEVANPFGLGATASYRKPPSKLPAGIETVSVAQSSAPHRFTVLSPAALEWLVAEQDVVELHGWSPVPGDPIRASYGRITLVPNGDVPASGVGEAAVTMLELLEKHGLGAIPLLDGRRGMALWIPFDDGPDYGRLAAWLGVLADEAVPAHPDVLTTEWRLSHRGNRVFIGTQTNHPANGTILPYTLRGWSEPVVAVPVPRKAIGTLANGDVTAENFGGYLAANGDVFGELRAVVGPQRLSDLVPVPMVMRPSVFDMPLDLAPHDLHSDTVAAALAVLRDGKTRESAAILAEAVARGLLPKSMKVKTLYLALHGYIVRSLGVGRVPEIAQIEKTMQFRINRPADDWPDVTLPPRLSWIVPAERTATIERLRKTATGKDTDAFEVAACDAFGLLNFVVEHIGGKGQADGLLMAPLGADGYRVILECKTASPGGVVSNPRPEEAAKFRPEHSAMQAPLPIEGISRRINDPSHPANGPHRFYDPTRQRRRRTILTGPGGFSYDRHPQSRQPPIGGSGSGAFSGRSSSTSSVRSSARIASASRELSTSRIVSC